MIFAVFFSLTVEIEVPNSVCKLFLGFCDESKGRGAPLGVYVAYL